MLFGCSLVFFLGLLLSPAPPPLWRVQQLSLRAIAVRAKYGVFWLGTYMALLDQGWLWWVTSVGAVPAALTGFAVGSLALFPGLPAAPFYTLAHFKCHTTKHKSKSA